MSVLMLATIGGLISFSSTSFGALLSLFTRQSATLTRWNLSIDFALGLMMSASIFSLIGPAIPTAVTDGNSITRIILMAVAGIAFVFLVKSRIEKIGSARGIDSNHLLLASVLMLHNFPEGLASGSALAGLDLKAALPILGAISLQNIPEGALMVMCLKTMGCSKRNAFLGGIGSGVVELGGGFFAGILLRFVQNILPDLLSFAGGSMIASVLIEIVQDKQNALQRVQSKQFVLGLICLPLIQLISF